MRLNLKVSNVQGLRANLRQYGRAARQRVVAAQRVNAVETYNVAAALCAFRTGFMLSKLRVVIAKSGLAFDVGWLAGDFIGRRNPTTGQIIRVFYPKYVVGGTRKQAAQDNLTPAAELTRNANLARISAALKPQRG